MRRESLRGVIRTEDGKPATAALVIATRSPDRAVFRTVADSVGRYNFEVDSGTGDYLVHVTVPGRTTLAAFRKRVTRAVPADSVIVLDIILKRTPAAAQELGAVRIGARRPTPTRGEERVGVAPGAVERDNSGLTAALSPQQRGELDAIAATMPGMVPYADGVSALGLPAAQNSVTLNGLSFPGAAIPRDVRTSVRLSTATYDPARGWFGGAETRIDVGAGRLFSDLNASVAIDEPALQAGRDVNGSSGQPFSHRTLGLAGSGSILADRLTYNYGVQASERSTDVATLNTLDAAALRSVGLARDSAARVLQLLTQAGVPRSGDGQRGLQASRSGSLLFRLNTPDVDPRTLKVRRQSGGVILYGLLQESDGANLTPLALRTVAPTTSNGIV